MLVIKKVIIKVSYWQKRDYFTDYSKMPLNRKPHQKETSQLISIVNQLTGFRVMRVTTRGNYTGNQTN